MRAEADGIKYGNIYNSGEYPVNASANASPLLRLNN